jgi:DNA-binding NarL/FixJ family response regulator
MKAGQSPSVKKASRDSDERILEWLQLRDKGLSWPKIGKRYGVSDKTVQNACTAVYAAVRGQ